MFEGLSDADFAAFSPAKWRSNVYNRERLEVKQRLAPLGRLLAEKLTTNDGPVFEMSTSVEHPALFNHKQVDAMHLYFSRGENARRSLDAIIDRARGVASLLDDPTPQRSHIFLAVSLHEDRVETTLTLHPEATVDKQNLLRKMQDPFEVDRLLSTLRELPEGFNIGLAPAVFSSTTLTRDDLVALIARFSQVSGSPRGEAPTLNVSRVLSRQEALAAAAELASVLAHELTSLVPIYRFAAWARDNDFVSVREALEKKKSEKRQHGLSPGDSIRIVRGFFSGQTGTIQAIDPRGVIRVLVGKLTAKLDAADVERR